LLAGAAMASVADEVSRKFFFAPVGGWESEVIVNPNSFLTVQMITNWSLEILQRELGSMRSANRRMEGLFSFQGARIGDTLNIRKPVHFVA